MDDLLLEAATALLLSLAGTCSAEASDGRAAERVAIACRALHGSCAPFEAHGLLPAGRDAPWAIVAGDPGDVDGARAASWCATLAEHGIAAFRIACAPAAAWWERAAQIGELVAQAELEATTPGAPLFGRIAPRRGVLLAEGGGAAAAARAAAGSRALRGVLLVDPAPAGTALAWLERVSVPVAVAASGAHALDAAQRWHAASRTGAADRWFVRWLGTEGLARDGAPASPRLERDVSQLCLAFAQCLLPAGATPRATFVERARRGAIDREVIQVANGARLSP